MARTKENDEAPADYSDFVLWFVIKNKSYINRCTRKRLIPNRYAPEDIIAYMQERMLDILQKRRDKGKPIEDPKIYFRKLIDFWCIEYQRMHGFCYSLPKRPRCPEAEDDISQYGFVYLQLQDSDDEHSYCGIDRIPQLGYIDSLLNTSEEFNSVYRSVGEDPDDFSTAWDALMLMVLPEDCKVLTYIYRYNLTVPQVSKQLNIAISTAYQRKERGLRAISGTLASFIDLDQDSWHILSETSSLSSEKINISQFFKT